MTGRVRRVVADALLWLDRRRSWGPTTSVWLYAAIRLAPLASGDRPRSIPLYPWEAGIEERRALRGALLAGSQVPLLITVAVLNGLSGQYGTAAAFAGVAFLIGVLTWVQVRNAALLERASEALTVPIDHGPLPPDEGARP